MIYKAGKRTSVENTKCIHFNLSAGTNSIDDFNTKIKKFVLQQRKDWEPPQIKGLKLAIPEDYHSWSPIIFLLRLVYKTIIFKRLRLSGQLYHLAHTKNLLIHHLLQSS